MGNGRVRVGAPAAQLRLVPYLGRQCVLLVLVGAGLWLLRDALPAPDPARILDTIHQIHPRQWALAALASAGSFWAVGRYDQVIHGLLGTGVAPGRARRAGVVSIAIAQFVGFGVLSGALVRWRLLPELSLGGALRVSLAVSLSFLAGWSVLAALAVLLSFGAQPLALAVLTLAALAGLVLLVQPRRLPALPGLVAGLAILALAFVDTALAAGALYVLLPDAQALAPGLVFTAFLLALGAGLVGGTPGGVGPFEVTLLALLPMLPAHELLASALGFRLVYYLAPALLGLAALLRGPAPHGSAPVPRLAPPCRAPYLPPRTEALLWHAPRAEANLLRQGEFRLLQLGDEALALAAPAGQALAMLADPLRRGTAARTLEALARAGGQMLRVPILYKATARTALEARRRGWLVLRIADEAWLDPRRFDCAGPARRQLRRALRKAARAGLRIAEGGRRLPLAQMAAVAADWAGRHGGERGFSMGRFAADYVCCQRVFLAWRGDELVGFVTFHETRGEWTLDLMRQRADAPDGCMHALVEQAIRSAGAMGCARLSLAALPAPPRLPPGWPAPLRRLAPLAGRLMRAEGLRRFKASFAPQCQPLYAAAPGPLALLIGLAGIATRIHRPVPLPAPRQGRPAGAGLARRRWPWPALRRRVSLRPGAGGS